MKGIQGGEGAVVTLVFCEGIFSSRCRTGCTMEQHRLCEQRSIMFVRKEVKSLICFEYSDHVGDVTFIQDGNKTRIHIKLSVEETGIFGLEAKDSLLLWERMHFSF